MATVLQQYCNSIVTVLLQYCSNIAEVLQKYCNSIATVLQHYCYSIAIQSISEDIRKKPFDLLRKSSIRMHTHFPRPGGGTIAAGNRIRPRVPRTQRECWPGVAPPSFIIFVPTETQNAEPPFPTFLSNIGCHFSASFVFCVFSFSS
jgi:hypothetical protein